MGVLDMIAAMFGGSNPEVTLSMVRSAAEAVGHPLSAISYDEKRNRLISSLSLVRDMTEGGKPAVKRAIIKGTFEKDHEYDDRLKHGVNIPICAVGCDVLSNLTYGNPVTREVFSRTEGRVPDVVTQLARGAKASDFPLTRGLTRAYRDVLEANNHESLDEEMSWHRCRDGVAVLKGYADEDLLVDENDEPVDIDINGLYLDRVDPEDAWPVWNPDRARHLLAVVEWRAHSRCWRVWTATHYFDGLDGSLRPKDGQEPVAVPHGWGQPPFVYMGDPDLYVGVPTSLLTDAVESQRELINMESVRWTGGREQTWATLVGSGRPYKRRDDRIVHRNKGTEPERPKVRVDQRIMWFESDQGDAKYINQNFPLAEMREDFKYALVRSMRLDLRLPGDLVADSNGPAEQPTTVQLHWLITLIRLKKLMRENDRYENERFQMILRPMSLYPKTRQYDVGMDFDFDDVDWTHKFVENPLPHDNREERKIQLEEVKNHLRTKGHYVSEHVTQTDDPDELAATLEELNAQADRELGLKVDPGVGDGEGDSGVDPAPVTPPPADGDVDPSVEEVGAITDAVDFSGLSLAYERAIRAKDLDLVNLIRHQLAAGLGTGVTLTPLAEFPTGSSDPEGSQPGTPREGGDGE